MKNFLGLLFAVLLIVSCSSKQADLSNYEKGIEATKNAQYEQAIKFFNSALNEENNIETKATIFYNIGFCYGIMKKLDKEFEYYNKASFSGNGWFSH